MKTNRVVVAKTLDGSIRHSKNFQAKHKDEQRRILKSYGIKAGRLEDGWYVMFGFWRGPFADQASAISAFREWASERRYS